MSGYRPIDMDEEEWIKNFREQWKQQVESRSIIWKNPVFLDSVNIGAMPPDVFVSIDVGNTAAQERLPNKCECGADSIGVSKHSDYCPKHEA